ncbi:hypothetical protein ACFL6I_11090 [candidate division KSB1 bacterium]
MSYRNQILLFTITGILLFWGIAGLIKHNKGFPSEIKIIIDAKVREDDRFQVYYLDEEDGCFTEEKSVKKDFQGSKLFQEIEFELPPSSNYKKLRLDIGINGYQKSIHIRRIILRSEYREYIFNSFAPDFISHNQYVSVDSINNIFMPKVISGGYAPQLTIHDTGKYFEVLNAPYLIFKYPYFIAFIISLIIILGLFVSRKAFAGFNAGEIVFITAFIIIILSPTWGINFNNVDSTENKEKRVLNPLPDFSISKSFARKFENYYNDNFGFRELLIQWGSHIKIALFRSSANPENAMLGKQGWIFYNKEEIFESYTHNDLLDEKSLEYLVSVWKKRKEELVHSGIKYFLTFWPNKPSIYPELLPYQMRLQVRDTLSKADQIIEYIRSQEPELKLIDIRPYLIKEKKKTQLYHKYDTHWNHYGAFIAYQAFFHETYQELGIQPKSINDFNVEWKQYKHGDLIHLIGASSLDNLHELNPTFTLKENDSPYEMLSSKNYPDGAYITKNENIENKQRVLVFNDSFTYNIMQFISLHFNEVYYINTGYDQEMINKVCPDIIIDAPVERYR